MAKSSKKRGCLGSLIHLIFLPITIFIPSKKQFDDVSKRGTASWKRKGTIASKKHHGRW